MYTNSVIESHIGSPVVYSLSQFLKTFVFDVILPCVGQFFRELTNPANLLFYLHTEMFILAGCRCIVLVDEHFLLEIDGDCEFDDQVG